MIARCWYPICLNRRWTSPPIHKPNFKAPDMTTRVYRLSHKPSMTDNGRSWSELRHARLSTLTESDATTLNGTSTGHSSRHMPSTNGTAFEPLRLEIEKNVSSRIRQNAAPIDVQIAVRSTTHLGGLRVQKTLQRERYHNLKITQNHPRRNPTARIESVHESHTSAEYSATWHPTESYAPLSRWHQSLRCDLD